MFRGLISKQILIISAAFCFALCVLLILFQVIIFPNVIILNQEKIRVEITPAPEGYKSNTAEQLNEADNSMKETPILPGVFMKNMVITIFGTENEGLNVRLEPGTDKPVVYLAQEGEDYRIIDGPVIKDSLIWWKITLIPDNLKSGWAVQDFFTTSG